MVEEIAKNRPHSVKLPVAWTGIAEWVIEDQRITLAVRNEQGLERWAVNVWWQGMRTQCAIRLPLSFVLVLNGMSTTVGSSM